MYCNQCGAPLPEGSRFCPGCAAPVSFQSAEDCSRQTPPPPAGVPCYFVPVQSVAVPPHSWNAPPFYTAAPGMPGSAPQPAYRRRKVKDSPAPPVCQDTAKEPCDTGLPDVQPSEDAAPLGFWQTLLALVALLYLPVGNILFACIWAFGEKAHPARRRLARAALPLIALSLLLLLSLLLFLTFNLKGFSLTFR